MKTCILITNNYPYNIGEDFVENEIGYLARAFSEVYCFAIDAQPNDNMTRKVPQNVKVFALDDVKGRKKYIVYIIKGLLTKDPDLKLDNWSIRKILLCLYFRGRGISNAEKIRRIICREKLNVSNVIVYSYWFSYQAISAWFLADLIKKDMGVAKSVSRAHGFDVYWDRNAFGYIPYQDVSMKKMDGVFPCSDNGREYLQRMYPKWAAKLKTARLGTRDYGVGKTPEDNSIVFVTCCYLKPIKRIPLFAEAFVELCKRGYSCKWVCIGGGDQLNLVKNIISQNGITDTVDFLGMKNNNEVMQFYRSTPVSFFCNVSTTEGLPVSIMEALSFGIPVIATDVGGTNELVNDSCGILLPKEIEKSELASALEKQIRISPKEYQDKRKQARLQWEKIVSAEKNYSIWTHTLDTL